MVVLTCMLGCNQRDTGVLVGLDGNLENSVGVKLWGWVLTSEIQILTGTGRVNGVS